jgi:hypothetical protein
MEHERLISSAVDEFLNALHEATGTASIPALTKSLGIGVDRQFLSRCRRQPRHGTAAPLADQFMEFVVKPVDRLLTPQSSDSCLLIAGELNKALLAWTEPTAAGWRVDASRFVKKWSLSDYHAAAAIRGDVRKLETVIELTRKPQTVEAHQWEEIVSVLEEWQRAAFGKSANIVFLHVCEAVVQAVLAFNGYPPRSSAADRWAARLHELLEWVGRSAHRKRFASTEANRRMRHQAILIRAMQFHAGCSIQAARKLYRQLIRFEDVFDLKDLRVDGRVVDICDGHYGHLVLQILSFEVCLSAPEHRKQYWFELGDLCQQILRKVKGTPSLELQCQRVLAEWCICRVVLDSPAIGQWLPIAGAAIAHMEETADPNDDWFAFEVLKLKAIVQAIRGENEAEVCSRLAELTDRMIRAKLWSQAEKAMLMKQLMPNINQVVALACQLCGHDQAHRWIQEPRSG